MRLGKLTINASMMILKTGKQEYRNTGTQENKEIQIIISDPLKVCHHMEE